MKQRYILPPNFSISKCEMKILALEMNELDDFIISAMLLLVFSILLYKQTKILIYVSNGIATQPIKGLQDTIKYSVYVHNSILNT